MQLGYILDKQISILAIFGVRVKGSTVISSNSPFNNTLTGFISIHDQFHRLLLTDSYSPTHSHSFLFV